MAESGPGSRYQLDNEKALSIKRAQHAELTRLFCYLRFGNVTDLNRKDPGRRLAGRMPVCREGQGWPRAAPAPATHHPSSPAPVAKPTYQRKVR